MTGMACSLTLLPSGSQHLGSPFLGVLLNSSSGSAPDMLCDLGPASLSGLSSWRKLREGYGLPETPALI